MSIHSGTSQILNLALATLLLSATQAMAAGASSSAEALARYRAEMAMCASGQSNQDRTTCQTEARNALAEARRGGLTDGSVTTYSMNAQQRCAAHTGVDRTACDARMRGEGSISGSVGRGGILRESVTVLPTP
ncbi:MAG: hypothetical protein ABIN37_15350 [Burkholderiaceae bacterium]